MSLPVFDELVSLKLRQQLDALSEVEHICVVQCRVALDVLAVHSVAVLDQCSRYVGLPLPHSYVHQSASIIQNWLIQLALIIFDPLDNELFFDVREDHIADMLSP